MSRNQIQIVSRPRHLRYIFFIDEGYSYDNLIRLIITNQRFWGGRYNPFIPVINNTIQKEYLEVIKYYDPDYIFYSNAVDVELLKQLRLFNPCGYFNLDEKPQREIISGVGTFYLFSRFSNYFFTRFINKVKLILKPELENTGNPLLNFYKINFGIGTDSSNNYDEIISSKDIIYIDQTNISSLNKLICEYRPINQAHLSRLNLNTRILRSHQSFGNNSFELVIAKDNSSITDLLYFWNRQLFECGNVIYSTLEEINFLAADKTFGDLLYLMSYDNRIQVISASLSQPEIKTIIDKLKGISSYRHFEYKNIEKFPFDVLDGNGLFENNYGETKSIQILSSNIGIYFIPKLSFTDKLEYYPQRYAIDLEIKKSLSDYRNFIKFPLNTDTRFLFRDVEGRIKRWRDISLIVGSQSSTSATLNVELPSFRDLMRQITQSPVIDGVVAKTKYINSGFNDSSNRLAAFIKLFNVSIMG